MVGEAPLPHVQLMAGDAQIDQYTVETTVCFSGFEQRRRIVKVAAKATKARLSLYGGQAQRRGFDGVGVPVNADQQTAGAESLQYLAGMTRSAQCAIEIDAGRFDVQAIQSFVQQHGKVVK